MARAISNTQKKAIFTELPASVTLDTTTINASKIWFNQEVTSHPTITFNISNDGLASDIRDVSDGVLYYECTLTLHILTENQDGFNGATIAEQFAADICAEIESWTTPLTSDVRIFNPDSDIKSIGNLGYVDEEFDYVISVTLYHS
ncbi:hypothetical protein V7O66_13745 [Methanolobus sp. ZRKC3]|uniref:hypothetical protein n=1 Tax=Methanolobus sp. ZRKC3 TaxID=3125786 RepID=UPI003250A6AC